MRTRILQYGVRMTCLLFAVLALEFLAEDRKAAWKRDPGRGTARQSASPRGGASDKTPPPDRLSHGRLEELAIRFDCYFTLEQFTAAASDERGRFEGAFLPNFRPADREEMLCGLATALPDFLVQLDDHSPAVVRLIDRRLVGRQDYWLNDLIETTFRGTPEELLRELEGRHTRVATFRMFPIGGGLPIGDWTSSLSIRGHRGTVRSLLTNYLPLSDYRTTLWRAHTTVEEGKLNTLVSFHGQWSKKLPWGKTIPRFPDAAEFTTGMLALYVNAGEAGKVGEALCVIEAEMGRPSPRSQVRWAMLFLGQEKAEAGIPVLLKHLTHQYTPWGVVRESYPAVKALGQIGPSASRACLRQLQDEDDALRRRLLCQVLLDQMGGEKAARALRDAGREADAAGRRRLMAAAAVLAGLIAEQTPLDAAP